MPAESTVCLLPGLLCDAAVWAPQRVALAARLADRAPIHIADLWGPDRFAAMAAKVLDEVSGPVALAGHSMGARVAMEMWRLAPDRVTRLALLNTGFHASRPHEQAARRELIDLAYAQGMAALAARWLPPMLHPDRLDDAALMAELTAMVCRCTPEVFEAQQTAGLHRPDATAYLGDIACPTLVLVGRQDGWSPLPQHEEMTRLIPSASLRVVERCGHMSTLERPQEVCEALVNWVI